MLASDYKVEVRINDYLDIICPHYEEGSVDPRAMERYTLYLVEPEEFRACKPGSKEQVRWECNKPSALHGPEKFSEKFQRFTPFTLGKEFKEGHSYYYICECPGGGEPAVGLGEGGNPCCGAGGVSLPWGWWGQGGKPCCGAWGGSLPSSPPPHLIFILPCSQAHSPPRRNVPEAEGDGGWQRQ